MKIWTNERSNNVHTQRTPLEHRATLHRTTRITLASLLFGRYAFESSRRDLHNALLCTALKSHKKLLEICQTIAIKKRESLRNLLKLAEFRKHFGK